MLKLIRGLNINKSVDVGVLKTILKPTFEVIPLTVKVVKITKKENRYSIYVTDTVTEVKMFLSPSVSHLINYLYTGRVITLDNYMLMDYQIAENKFVKMIVITSIDKIDHPPPIKQKTIIKYPKIEIQFIEEVHPDLIGPVYDTEDKFVIKSFNPVK